jgi:phenylacetate-CoA ligase
MGVPMIAMGGFDLKRRINFINTRRPTVMATTPSYALHMGETMREMGLDPAASSIRLIASGGEPGASIPATKRRIEEMWNAELCDWFGATEFGPAAHTCRPQGRRTDSAPEIHFMEDCYLVEVVDPETHEPVPDGQPGMLVVTGLATEGVPTLRYFVGDIVTLSRTACPCGRTGVRAVGGIQGRADDMLSVFGVHVYPSAIEDVIRGVPELSEAYEIVIEREGTTDRVTIVAEPRRELTDAQRPAIAAKVEQEVRSQLELRVKVNLSPYGSLPRDFKVRRIRDLRTRER